MNILLLRGFNNYFNRVVKKYSTLTDYRNNSASYLDLASINFNPNDGITTELILGSSGQKENNAPFDWEALGTPDYLICYESDTIKLRWYVMHVERTRSGQYRLQLKRDLLADYLDCYKNATTFVEKGWLPASNKLIYNSESVEVSEIKVNETFLSDATYTPWIVAYVAKNAIDSDKELVIPGEEQAGVIDVAISDIANFELYQYSQGTPLKVRPNNITAINAIAHFNAYNASSGGGRAWSIDLNANRQASFSGRQTYSGTNMYTASYDYFSRAAEQLQSVSASNKDAIFNAAVTDNIINAVTQNQLNTWRNDYDNKVIRLTNGRLYSITFRSVAVSSENARVTSSQYSRTFNAMGNVAQILKDSTPTYISWVGSGLPNDWAFDIDFTPYAAYIVNIEELPANEVTTTLKTIHRNTEDAIYDIYCVPYWTMQFAIYRSSDSQSYYQLVNQNEKDSMNAMLSLKEKLGSSVYDIQILPYCPLRDLMGLSGSKITVDEDDENKVFSLFKETVSGTIKAAIFFSKISQFEFDIVKNMRLPNLSGSYGIPTLTQAENIKLVDGATKYRLVSPNYCGQFEFSLAKNGSFNRFNVDCTYKPFNPYIHVNPAFAGLYGQDWNDARGLICSGDFSISQVSDAFTEYELRNKNFQQVFDRQIENMDVNNSIARTEAMWGAVAGTLKGGSTGIDKGFKVGGIPGAVIGGVVGTAASAIGGVMDYSNMLTRQEEARNFAIDMYGYNLANVKAIPYSLTKVGPLNGNNKLFPFVETYYATDEEFAAFAKKVKADGMTVMAVGTLDEMCLQAPSIDGLRMFKGQIIRFDDPDHPLTEDADLASAINEELKKGAYF